MDGTSVEETLRSLGSEAFCYVTTIGRVSGQPHRIEIWFAAHGSSLYLLSGGRDRADWVRNIVREPSVEVEVGDASFTATGRIVTDPDEETTARRLLLDKYAHGYSGDLSGWGARALPVALDLAP